MSKMADQYQNGERVLIHSVDDSGREFPATVCGLSADFPIAKFYIVKPDNMYDLRLTSYPYECLVVPSSCLKRA